MARGLSRELAKEKAQKKQGKNASKGNKEDLTPARRAERDAKTLREKTARKEAARAALAASGEAGAAAVKAEEAKKAAMRAKHREKKFAAANPLLAKKRGCRSRASARARETDGASQPEWNDDGRGDDRCDTG